MNMPSTSKAASKRSRATTEQLSGMVDFFPGLAAGKFQRLHGKLEHEKKWEKMATKLNGMGGAQKSADQWRTVWRDLKSRTSNRVRDRRRQQGRKQAHRAGSITRAGAACGCHYWQPLYRGPSIRGRKLANGRGASIVPRGRGRNNPKSISRVLRRSRLRSHLRHPYNSCVENNAQEFEEKEAEDESEVQKKFLDIAQTQADAMKMLAESFTRLVETQASIANGLQAFGGGMTVCAEAINNLARALGPQ